MSKQRKLDVITIGRSSVDLYCQQVGTRLQDAQTFKKSVGGCPSNIAIGCSRLGLNAGVITVVGGEPLGDFIIEQFQREGVDTSGVRSDPTRLSALAILSVQDRTKFPLLFYRENCADLSLCEDDIDPAFITSSKSIVVTGTHFSRPNTAAAQRKAIRIAVENGVKVIFDIDYRPNLWGLGSHADGEQRFVASDEVTQQLKDILPACSVIVGTEEELAIAGGSTDVLESLRAVRAVSKAVIVLKRGAKGCVVFDGHIPDDVDQGIVGKGFPITVYNVLGAGDSFMSGFLRGYLRDETLETACMYGNGSGAMAVSRLMCSSEIPTFGELQEFIKHGSREKMVRHDAELNYLHWATTRTPKPKELMAFAIDHRIQLEQLADKAGVSHDRISDFKILAVEAAQRVSDGQEGFGMLLDEKHGADALLKLGQNEFWIGRPVELPGSRPLDFEFGGDIGSRLVEWPVNHVVKCLCFYHEDDAPELKEKQERELLRIFDAARRVEREILIEIISGKHGKLTDNSVANVVSRLYDIGIKPDIWKLESLPSAAAWKAVGDVVRARDPYCQGIVVLGLEAPIPELKKAFATAATEPLVKGFAVGRSLFAATAERWLASKIGDDDAVSEMAENFRQLVDCWRAVKAAH